MGNCQGSELGGGLTQPLPCPGVTPWQLLDVLLVEMAQQLPGAVVSTLILPGDFPALLLVHIWAAWLDPMGYTTAGGWGWAVKLAGIPLLGMEMELVGICRAGGKISVQFLPSALPRLQ